MHHSNSYHVIDAHCHLPQESTEQSALKRPPLHLSHAIVNSSAPSDWEKISHLASSTSSPTIIPAFGIHPWAVREEHLHDAHQWEKELEHYLKIPHATIGEIGLDFSKKWKRTRSLQITIFQRQMEIAARKNKLVSIHCVHAWGALLECIAPLHSREILPPLLIHSFHGSIEIARALTTYPHVMLSLSVDLFEQRQNDWRDYIEQIPPDRLAIETDAPFGERAELLYRAHEASGGRLGQSIVQYLERAEVRPAFSSAVEEVLTEHKELLKELAK